MKLISILKKIDKLFFIIGHVGVQIDEVMTEVKKKLQAFYLQSSNDFKYKYRFLKRLARDTWLQIKDSTVLVNSVLSRCLTSGSADLEVLGVHLLIFYMKSAKELGFTEFMDFLPSMKTWQGLDQAYRAYCNESSFTLDSHEKMFMNYLHQQDFFELHPNCLRVFLSILACKLKDDEISSLQTTRVTNLLLKKQGFTKLEIKGVERYFKALLEKESSKFYAIYYSLQSSQSENQELLKILSRVIEQNTLETV